MEVYGLAYSRTGSFLWLVVRGGSAYIGQSLPVHEWRLAVWAYAVEGCAGRFSQYTRSGVRPSAERGDLS